MVSSPDSPFPRKTSAAFTLIELLVVISIIAVLAGIAYPVLMSSQLRAKSTTSLNNMRQIGLAFSTYAADADGRFPAAVEPDPASTTGATIPWSKKLIDKGYLPTPSKASDNPFLCPFDPAGKGAAPEKVRSYAYNNMDAADKDEVNRFGIENQSSTILLTEFYANDPKSAPGGAYDNDINSTRKSGGIYGHHYSWKSDKDAPNPTANSMVLFFDLRASPVKHIADADFPAEGWPKDNPTLFWK